jgi:hypothetical protein
MLGSSCSSEFGDSERADQLSRHLRYYVNALNRTIDLAGEAPDAVPLVGDNRLLPGLVPANHVDKTSLKTGFAAATCFLVDFDSCAHLISRLRRIGNLRGADSDRAAFRYVPQLQIRVYDTSTSDAYCLR